MLHDLRRTAARNLTRAGVARHVAMRILGLKTEAMWRRYSIVETDDLRDGFAKVLQFRTETKLAREAWPGFGRSGRFAPRVWPRNPGSGARPQNGHNWVPSNGKGPIFWGLWAWRRGESNPGPSLDPNPLLRA